MALTEQNEGVAVMAKHREHIARLMLEHGAEFLDNDVDWDQWHEYETSDGQIFDANMWRDEHGHILNVSIYTVHWGTDGFKHTDTIDPVLGVEFQLVQSWRPYDRARNDIVDSIIPVTGYGL